MNDKITIERETLERAVDILDRRLNWNPVVDKLCSEINAALAAQPVSNQLSGNPGQLAAQQAEPQEPVASYWLIECKNGFTGWYTSHRLDCRFFDTDPRKAYKFASKELAENEISGRGHSCMTATEHVDIAAPPAPAAVPPGYALVPIEPTPEMVDAGDVARHSVLTQARTSVIYRAMIAAAGDKP